MVEIVRRGNEKIGNEENVFTVYKTKEGVITEISSVAGQAGYAAVFSREPLGLPVEEAFKRTLGFCERYNIPILFIEDQHGLWPDCPYSKP